MMKKNIIKVSAISALLLLSFVMFNSFDKNKEVDINNLPISYLHADFLVNTNEPREVVGAADYYFVAKVDEVVGITYKYPVTIETQSGYKQVSDPYTNYKITVVENIKGNLQKDVSIDITKAGGVAQDKRTIILFEEDSLLEVGKYYIITAFAQPDGSLLISGPNSNELVTTTANAKSVQVLKNENTEYKEYKQIYAEQVNITRERFSSKFDQ